MSYINEIITNPGLSNVAIHIWSFLHITDEISNCRLVCKSWQTLIDNSIFYWKARHMWCTTRKLSCLNKWPEYAVMHCKLTSCKNMSDYESAHLVSCQELMLCGSVGRFIISKVHIDIIAKSVKPKT